jgi:hypothetical protein
MPDSTSSAPSLWLSLIVALPGYLIGVAAIVQQLLARQKAGSELTLLNLQAAVSEVALKKADAEIGKTNAERDSLAFNIVSKALQDAERTLERLRSERDAAENRERMLEFQLEREVEWRKGNGWPGPSQDGCF